MATLQSSLPTDTGVLSSADAVLPMARSSRTATHELSYDSVSIALYGRAFEPEAPGVPETLAVARSAEV